MEEEKMMVEVPMLMKVDFPMFTAQTVIQRADTGVICVEPNASGAVLGNANSPVHYPQNGAYSSLMLSDGSLNVNGDDALDITSVWWKVRRSANGASIGVASTDGAAFTNQPTIDIEIPKNVKSGNLLVRGVRRPFDYVNVNNDGAGNGFSSMLFASQSIVTVTTDLEELWVWEAGGDVIDCVTYGIEVDKKLNETKVITLNVDIDLQGPSGYVIDFEIMYQPYNVTIEEIFYISMDVAPDEPLQLALDDIRLWSEVRADEHQISLKDMLSRRLGYTVTNDVYYLNSWGNLEIGVKSDFLREFTYAYNIITKAINTDLYYLKNNTIRSAMMRVV
jgi:hypothetical protein